VVRQAGQVGLGGEAVLGKAARLSDPAGEDALARGPVADVGADALEVAADFVAEEAARDAAAALAAVEVVDEVRVAADAAGLHAEEHIVGAGLRDRALFEGDLLAAQQLPGPHAAAPRHGCSPTAAAC
jgi:hypothetical protein